MSQCPSNRSDANRKLRCEVLERREMLSANAPDAIDAAALNESASVPAVIAPAIDSSLAGRDQALAISAVHLRIDGRDVSVASLDQIVEMHVGSSLQVVGIEYRLNGETSVSGKVAFEAYLNKLKGSGVDTDYRDGRFGGHEQEGELPFGSASHSGLDGEWKLEAGTESFTLVMVRYGANEVAVEDRITIRTQVGTPDFVINPEVKVYGSGNKVYAGRSVKIYGTWANAGEGTYRSYAEVDIYHESDPTKVVWSGALADVVEGGETDKGKFVNKVKQDGFSTNWIPELGGTYTLKFYADPENHWNESNEDNNVFTQQVAVEDLRTRASVRDAFLGYGFNHHSVAEAPTPDLSAAASSLTASTDDSLTISIENGEQKSSPVYAATPSQFVDETDIDHHGASESRVEIRSLASIENVDKSNDGWLDAIDEALTSD